MEQDDWKSPGGIHIQIPSDDTTTFVDILLSISLSALDGVQRTQQLSSVPTVMRTVDDMHWLQTWFAKLTCNSQMNMHRPETYLVLIIIFRSLRNDGQQVSPVYTVGCYHFYLTPADSFCFQIIKKCKPPSLFGRPFLLLYTINWCPIHCAVGWVF